VKALANEFADEHDGEDVNKDLPEVDLEEAVRERGPYPEVGRVEVARRHGHRQHRRLRVGQEVAAHSWVGQVGNSY